MSEYSVVLRAVKAAPGSTSTQLMTALKQDSLQTVVDALTLMVAQGIITKAGNEPTATYTAVAGRS